MIQRPKHWYQHRQVGVHNPTNHNSCVCQYISFSCGSEWLQFILYRFGSDRLWLRSDCAALATPLSLKPQFSICKIASTAIYSNTNKCGYHSSCKVLWQVKSVLYLFHSIIIVFCLQGGGDSKQTICPVVVAGCHEYKQFTPAHFGTLAIYPFVMSLILSPSLARMPLGLPSP